MNTPGPVSDADQDRDDLFCAARDRTQNYLQKNKTRQAPATLTRDLLNLAEHLLCRFESKNPAVRKDCREGCTYCCHYDVIVSPPEVFLIGKYMDQSFSEHHRKVLTERLDRYLGITQKKTPEERILALQDTPCAFLDEGRCLIYGVRPFICRAWNGIDRQQCRQAFVEGHPLKEVDRHAYPYYIFGTVKKALQQGCANQGYQASDIQLAPAIKQYLFRNTIMNQWLQGENVFTPLQNAA